jgi:hypothetical protein
MSTDPSTMQPTGSMATTSLEGLFLFHYLFSLTRLQQILTDPVYVEESARFNAFTLQSQYILHLIPEKSRRDDIQTKIDEVETKLKTEKKYTGEYANIYIARMLVVSEIVKYLTESLDLIHSDILGSISRKAADIISLEEEGVFDGS